MKRHRFPFLACSAAWAISGLITATCCGQSIANKPTAADVPQWEPSRANSPATSPAPQAVSADFSADRSREAEQGHDTDRGRETDQGHETEVDSLAAPAAIRPTTALQASRLTNHGMKLALKGAMFSAREKFVEALEVIADSLDAENQTQFHSRALASGLVALREVNDFSRAAGTLELDDDPVTKAAGHSTPILKHAPPHSVTRLQALQLYFAYSTRQLSAAIGNAPQGSTALCSLGRIQPFLSESLDGRATLADPKAIALFQASILVDPKNHQAVNELGVVFAQCGQFQAAKKALLYSVSVQPQFETLKNLAIVYNRLGDAAGSKAMRERAALIAGEKNAPSSDPRHSAANSGLVYWVDHKTFAGEKPSGELTTAAFVNEAPASAVPPRPEPTQPEPARPASVRPAPAVPQAPTGQGQQFLEALSWDVYAQGEYIGPARLAHVPEYLLRVDDQLVLVFRLGGKPTTTPYHLNVGDVIHISSLTMTNVSFDTLIQPDGTIVLPQVGQLFVAGKTMEGLRTELDQRFRQFLKEPAITITPVAINKVLEELRNAVINRNGIYAGQALRTKISPDGTIQMPGLGSLPAQGMSMAELQREIEARYAEIVSGIEVTVTLSDRAPRGIFILGEVARPGRVQVDSPTTVIGAIAMAGGWNIGGNTRQVIVLRRDENWRLMATRVNVKPALYNHRGLCADDIWLRDSDIVIVPKQCIQVADDIIQLWLSRGVYGVVPFGGVTFSLFRTL